MPISLRRRPVSSAANYKAIMRSGACLELHMSESKEKRNAAVRIGDITNKITEYKEIIVSKYITNLEIGIAL